MSELSTERRPSGVWTIYYQPELPKQRVDAFQKAFDYLGNIVITNTRFNACKMRGLACFQVTIALAEPVNLLLGDFGFQVDNYAILSFGKDINSTINNTPQSGQFILRITPIGTDKSSYFGIIDPACYLYGINYENMPVAVGNQEFIESAMTEIYSNLTGDSVNAKLIG